MEAYYNDGRGRYGTGESYDWFYRYEDEDAPQIFTSSDGLWTYGFSVPNEPSDEIELLRYNGNAVNITVPAVVDGKKVVSLDSTFDGFYELESAVVPEGVISIVGAFYGCENLKKVTLPQGLKCMEYALNCCFSLREIFIPSSVEDFSDAFAGTAITAITFPRGTKTIARAFAGTDSIQKAVLPKSVTDTEEAFSDCENLTEVTLEDGIAEIGDYTFFHCPSLLELTIPESVRTFGEFCVGYMEIREYTNPQKTGYRMKGECIVPGFRIKGVRGSAAEKYARDNGIPFVETGKGQT